MIKEVVNTQEDLTEAIKEALIRKGVYSKIKSQIRAEVYHSLEDKTVSMPEKPRDVFIATELIIEFMMNLQLNNSLSVFSEEVGQPSEMLVDREFIASELGLNAMGTSEKIPLIILLIQHLMNQKEQLFMKANESLIVEVDEN
eukprot:gene11085-14880_t